MFPRCSQCPIPTVHSLLTLTLGPQSQLMDNIYSMPGCYLGKMFCKVFSASSAVDLQLPCCPCKQGELSENCLQSKRPDLSPCIVVLTCGRCPWRWSGTRRSRTPPRCSRGRARRRGPARSSAGSECRTAQRAKCMSPAARSAASSPSARPEDGRKFVNPDHCNQTSRFR